MEPKSRTEVRTDGTRYTPKYVDGMRYLEDWKELNRSEYEELLEHQAAPALPESEAFNSIDGTNEAELHNEQECRLEDTPEQSQRNQRPPMA